MSEATIWTCKTTGLTCGSLEWLAAKRCNCEPCEAYRASRQAGIAAATAPTDVLTATARRIELLEEQNALLREQNTLLRQVVAATTPKPA